MNKLLGIGFATTVALAVATVAANAGERLNDAALGAVSGAIVGGPVGLVAGGVIGYTAGPGIARSWGLKHRHHARGDTASNHRTEKTGENRPDGR
jgi:MFS family permease